MNIQKRFAASIVRCAALCGLAAVTLSHAADWPPKPGDPGYAVYMAQTAGSRPPTDARPVFWATKQALLEATRAGQLLDLARAQPEEKAKVVASVERILVAEYQVPPLSKDCYSSGPFPGDVLGLLVGISELGANTLSDQPPNFVTGKDLTVNKAALDERIARMRDTSNRTLCDGEALGRTVPAPYKAALVKLISEYAQASSSYVGAEHDRRVAVYQKQAAQLQQQQAAQQAASNAAQQQSIDADAARIKAEEERRARVNKSRIGG